MTYCINLLRYCSNEFSDGSDKTEQMFALTLNTLQKLYEELGLLRSYSRLKAKMGAVKVVGPEVVAKLLVRCQIVLAIRGEVVKILN